VTDVAQGRDWRWVAAVGLGGALGAPARYGIATVVDITPGTFPWGTFWINVSGSFALGSLLVVLRRRLPRARYVRPFLGTGFLGAYTTYSTFAVETDLLARNGHWGIALAYTAGTIVVGLAAAVGGMALVRGR
jgi:CrcB protein